VSLSAIKRPCDECPWRKDAEPERFTRDRWDSLARSSARPDGSSAEYFDPLFACHKTDEGKERVCAGWLAMEGINHPRIRLGLVVGEISSCSLEPKPGWPDLHPDFHTTRAHDLMED
jgi:hypothetical protein